ncbi:hypothetical protein VP01_947g6 [Puccinia sorghi]|uniref:Uncharacterized protein n=1 Tax=Puccinia sorghi TaxID=27349 RepID=A0A0L6U6I0_9BASI|nr:hypothetical protein VP01_947g6 [Puccinia sorghi]
MVFVPYAPATKFNVFHLSLKGYELCEICNILRSRTQKIMSSDIHENLYNGNQLVLSIQAIQDNLVNKLCITFKKAEMVNIKRFLVAKYAWVEQMCLVSAKLLAFIKIIIPDKIAICDCELLQAFFQSPHGTPAHQLIIRQNPEQSRILPAIGLHGTLKQSEATHSTGRIIRHRIQYWFLIIPAPIEAPGLRKSVMMWAFFWFVSPYFPELNPNELCFASMNSKLCQTQILTYALDPAGGPLYFYSGSYLRFFIQALQKLLLSSSLSLSADLPWELIVWIRL